MTLKRDRYLELKHKRLANCGQCIGFRAKGIDLANTETKPACDPAVDCHKARHWVWGEEKLRQMGSGPLTR